MFLTIEGVGSLTTENGLQMPRFYPYLVELKLYQQIVKDFCTLKFYPYLVELKLYKLL